MAKNLLFSVFANLWIKNDATIKHVNSHKCSHGQPYLCPQVSNCVHKCPNGGSIRFAATEKVASQIPTSFRISNVANKLPIVIASERVAI